MPDVSELLVACLLQYELCVRWQILVCVFFPPEIPEILRGGQVFSMSLAVLVPSQVGEPHVVPSLGENESWGLVIMHDPSIC